MSQPTPNDMIRSEEKDEQQTLLQTPAEKPADALYTAFQAVSSAPRIDVGPVPLTRVAEYELLKEVGRGGMGVVFKARHVRLNRIVALKMIRGGALANSEELQRFEKEAAAAAQLQHPNIVALYEVSAHNQQPFLSMEYIGGTSLAERLSLGPLSGRRAAEYLELTARAVHYAHSKGIVHRDLKPANVLLDENDQPKVTDFGLAKQLETESDQTRTGAILGTPSYMSPEQAAGSKDITPASDVYSLGAVLYELVTGKPPFTGETPLKTLKMVAEQDPIPPRMLTPTVDRDLETICLKCLEKAPARRYETAESLADDLRRYLHGEPITARRVNILGRAAKWVRRNPSMTWLIVGITTAVIAIVMGSWYIAYDEMEQREKERDLREKAQRSEKIADDRFKAMRSLLYLSQLRQAQQSLRRADLDGALRILNNWLPKDAQPDMRDWEWHFLKDRAEQRHAFASHSGPAFAVDYRPDGTKLASAGMARSKAGAPKIYEIKIWDVRNGALVHTLDGHTDVITALAHHPTRPILASASHDKTVKLWNLDTGKEIMTLRGHTNNVYCVAFSPKTGNRLASSSHDLSVRIWEWESYPGNPEASVRVLMGHDLPVTGIAFHPDPDSNLLASGSSDRPAKTGGRDHTIKLWNIATGSIDKTFVGHEGDVASLAFTANGKTLVSGGGKPNQAGEVIFWDVKTGTVDMRRRGLTDRITHVSISPDDKVAAAGADGLLRVWNPNSTEPLTFRGDPQQVNSVAFAPNGFSLASAGRSGHVSLWNSSAGSETLSLGAGGNLTTLAFNPRGSFLAAAGANNGEVLVWDLDHPDQYRAFHGHKRKVQAVAFSPDGHFLASGGDDLTVRIVDFRAANPDKNAIVLKGHDALIHAIAYHPDGDMIASAGENDEILLHNPKTGELIKKLKADNGILCLAFSPDGRWLAAGGWGQAKQLHLWDVKTGETHRLEGHTGPVNAVAFGIIDGEVSLASGSNDKTIRVWDVARRDLRFKLEGTPGEVQSIAYHPHGRRIVSVGTDRLIRIWDIVTRQEILDFEEHVGTLRRVAFSADGRSLAGAGNGVVRVWQASRELLR